jgi:hypothetical protein
MAALKNRDCYAMLRQPALQLQGHCRQLVNNSDAFWLPHFGFQALPLDKEWIAREPALREVAVISPIAQLGILRMLDHWTYQWHRDQNRLACINLLLSTDHHSHTLFGAAVNDVVMHCLELTYRPDRFYLFNNQIPHSVINLGPDRYLFSIEFVEPLPYAELRTRFARAGLLDTCEGA